MYALLFSYGCGRNRKFIYVAIVGLALIVAVARQWF
jgi:hypothetical protein